MYKMSNDYYVKNSTEARKEHAIAGSFVHIPEREYLYKVLVIGEFGVGKTSIIRRYTEGYFTPNYKLTIGVDFALKTLKWDTETRVNLQLWDIAGHERFGHMTRVYYKYAIAAIIVFDLSRPATFDSILKWLDDINSKVMLSNEQPVPILLLANKSDIENTVIDRANLERFCRDKQLIGWFATSAKSDTNIKEAMEFLIERILELPVQSMKAMEHIELSCSQMEEELSSESVEVRHESHRCCFVL